MNKWCGFSDNKINQFFEQQNQRVNGNTLSTYGVIIHGLIIVIIKTLWKSNEIYLAIATGLLTIQLPLRNKKYSWIIGFIVDILIQLSLQTSRESNDQFLLRMIFQSLIGQQILLTMSWSFVLKYDLGQSVFQIIRWIYTKDYSIQKISVFAAIGVLQMIVQILVVVNFEYLYKKNWLQLNQVKKSKLIIEKILQELPIGHILFNQAGGVVLQNQYSYKLLPKDIDLVTKQYTGKQTTIDQLLLSEEDLETFKNSFQEALVSNNQQVLQLSFEASFMEFKCYIQKESYEKGFVVQCVLVEMESDSLYKKTSQSIMLNDLQQISETISKNGYSERTRQLVNQLQFGKQSPYDYSHLCRVGVNLKNYFKMLADLLQMTYDVNQQFRMDENLPERCLIDIVKLHAVLSDLISYIYQEYSNRSNGRSAFAQFSFNIKMVDELLEISIQTDFSSPLQEIDMLFKHDTEQLSNQEYRKAILHDSCLNSSHIVHIAHQINQVKGTFSILEKQDYLKIVFGLRLNPYDQPAFFDDYIPIVKLDPNSKVYQWQSCGDIKLSQGTLLIHSTQRITPKQQLSLSEQKNLTVCRLDDIIIRPNPEEEKDQENSPRSAFIDVRNQEPQNIDVDEKISYQMPSIEKAVSKTIEHLLTDIMQYRGRKLNLMFKNTKPRQRSHNDMSPPSSKKQGTVPAQFRSPIIAPMREVRDGMKDSFAQNNKTKKVTSFLQQMRENENTHVQKIVASSFDGPIRDLDQSPHSIQDQSPHFSKQVTFNQINDSEKIIDKLNLSIDNKVFYNDVFTLMLIDDAAFVVTALTAMKFSVPVKVDASTKIPDAMLKIQAMINSQKIYHIILMKIKMPNQDIPKIVADIRQFESNAGLPKQFIIGLDCDVNPKLIADYPMFDDHVEKPLNQKTMEILIQKRIADLRL